MVQALAALSNPTPCLQQVLDYIVASISTRSSLPLQPDTWQPELLWQLPLTDVQALFSTVKSS